MGMVHPQKFTKVIYFTAAGAGDNGGGSYSNAKSMAADNTNVWPIPAGTLIEKMYLIIDTAITGTTNLDFGDDDNPDGFIDSSLGVTLGTPGMYGYDAKLAGAYLRVETAGVTDPADVDTVAAAKFYSATGKEVKMDLTTAGSAGAFRLVIEGMALGAY